MSVTVRTSHERARGCGFRKGGGKYLVSDGITLPCGKLPLELDVCPTCHAGFKPSRGFTWVDGDALFATKTCDFSSKYCGGCKLSTLNQIGKVGLLWIGEQHYKTPEDWSKETYLRGVSRRIAQIPKDLKVGKTLILVAHRKVFIGGVHKPAVFHGFIPTAIEYVIKGTETEEELESLIKRGLSLVKVVPIEEQPVLPLEKENPSVEVGK